MSLQQTLRDFLRRVGTEKSYLVAYSGGLDSQVLLALCGSLRDEMALDLRAIHINHQLSPNADKWAAHCQQVCQSYGIELIQQNINIDLHPGDSLEEIARNIRYQAITDHLGDDSVLLTAHHQDDQAETLLLQLFRGAGLKGLAAMPTIRALGRGQHARPLLAVTRVELTQYAKEHSLKWIEDESNTNVTLNRNFLRHEVLPLLTARWPALTSVLARSASHCAEAQKLLDEYALGLLIITKGSQENTLSVTRLLALDDAKRRLVLRAFIQGLGLTLPDTKTLNILYEDLLLSPNDAMPLVSWGEVEVRRHRDDLYAIRTLAAHDPGQMIKWEIDQVLTLPGIGRLSAVPVIGSGMRLSDGQLSIRFRQGGEIVSLPLRGRHTLKNLFQEWNVPTWLRDRIPLVYVDDRLVGVLGYFIDPEVCAGAGEEGYELCWERSLSK